MIEMTMEELKPKSELKKAYSVISSSERIFRYWCQWPETDLDLKDMASIINAVFPGIIDEKVLFTVDDDESWKNEVNKMSDILKIIWNPVLRSIEQHVELGCERPCCEGLSVSEALDVFRGFCDDMCYEDQLAAYRVGVPVEDIIAA